MAFKDKFNSVVKTVGDKTSETIEVTKLKTKISKEKSSIRDNYEKIGEYFYKQYRDNGYTNDELTDMFRQIDESRSKIKDYDKEIKHVKLED